MAIIDADVCLRAGWRMEALASAFVAGGARLLQVRVKSRPSSAFLQIASAIVRIGHDVGATVIVNDRADIARLSGADGVHVGQDDLSPRAVRRVVGADAFVGLSTHTRGQLVEAISRSGPNDGISYIAVGPMFKTATKDTGYVSLGLERLREAALLVQATGIPLVAIGGITLETAGETLRAGASAVAVISDLMTADPASRVRAFLERLTV